MESTRGLDQIWMIRFLMATKELVAMALWQSYVSAEKIQSMISAIDQASWHIHPQPPSTSPLIKKHFQRTLRYDVAALGTTLTKHIRPYAKQLPWHTTATAAHCDFIGPNGIAHSHNLRIGLQLIAPSTPIPLHSHPADEIYFVLSGQARFKMQNRPWRTCPSGQYIFHDSNIPHQIETRQKNLLALYLQRGEITTFNI